MHFRLKFFIFSWALLLNITFILTSSNSDTETIKSNSDSEESFPNDTANDYNNSDFIRQSTLKEKPRNLVYSTPPILIPNQKIIALEQELLTPDNNSFVDLRKTSNTITKPQMQTSQLQQKKIFPLNKKYSSLPSLSSSEASTKQLTEELAAQSTRFFIIPYINIYDFFLKMESLITKDPESQKNLFKELQETFIWRTISKIDSQDNKSPLYLLEKFTQDSISVNDLYNAHKKLFLTNKNPYLIKSFLRDGLSLEIQDNLFQEVFNPNSQAYLNATLAHTLIIYGYSIELLEHYRNQQELSNQNIKSQSITEILESNITNLVTLSKQIKSFNPCILEDGVSQELKEIIKKKIICLVRYYNIKMNDLHQIALINKDKINVQKLLQMNLNNLSKHSYESMTKKAVVRYEKIQ